MTQNKKLLMKPKKMVSSVVDSHYRLAIAFALIILKKQWNFCQPLCFFFFFFLKSEMSSRCVSVNRREETLECFESRSNHHSFSFPFVLSLFILFDTT